MNHNSFFTTALTLLLFFALSEESVAAQNWVQFFPSADNSQQQGFLRLTNSSDATANLVISGMDDSGSESAGPVTLSLAAGSTTNFNSQDLENGNTDKGLSGAFGDGTGSWRLLIDSDQPIEAAAYFRTGEGFVNVIHQVAAEEADNQFFIPFFNPASNVNQVSRLRLVNAENTENLFTISAIDDSGTPGTENVMVTLSANESIELSSIELEQGSARTSGLLGNGKGKWQLSITSSGSTAALSLLEDPSGYLSNLSNAATLDAAGDIYLNFMLPQSDEAESFVRIINRTSSTANITVSGIDDQGDASPGDINIVLEGHQSINFRSEFYEGGNEFIGLVGALGTGSGDWRLKVSSDQNVAVMGLFRTPNGFLNSTHQNLGSASGTVHKANFFNPASNQNQLSILRINNLELSNIDVTISGTDDKGNSTGASIGRVIPALSSFRAGCRYLGVRRTRGWGG